MWREDGGVKCHELNWEIKMDFNTDRSPYWGREHWYDYFEKAKIKKNREEVSIYVKTIFKKMVVIEINVSGN